MTEPRKKITLPYLFDKVSRGEPITWLTCYDYAPSARRVLFARNY